MPASQWFQPPAEGVVFPQLGVVDASVVTVVCSVLSYLYFKTREPKDYTTVTLLLVVLPGLLASLWTSPSISLPWALFLSVALHNGLIASFTLAYRLSPLHPLARYPGPFLARVSKWYSVYVILQGKQHIHYQHLHEQHGPVVRVGPNELSMNDPSAAHDMLMHGGLPKGPFWDGWGSPPTLIATRHVGEHAHRRRAWNRALSAVAVRDYEGTIATRSRQLVERWKGLVEAQASAKDEKTKSALIDLSRWMGFFTADFMGDMSFGGGFELIRDGADVQGMWHILESGVKSNAILAHVSWFALMYHRIVGGNRDRLRSFARENVQRRLKLGADRKDLFYHLSDEEGYEPRPLPSDHLARVCAEGALAIVAGADTTAITLTGVLFHVLTDARIRKQLQEEVDASFPDGEEPLDAMKLSKMDFLTGCINESLRLYPAVLTGSQRRVERGTGKRTLGGWVVPQETQVFTPTYTMQRDPRYFSNPTIFLPERWLPSNSTPIHNTAAFLPFSAGPTICAGKALAMLEMRMLLVWLVQRFEFTMPAGESGRTAAEWPDTLEDFFAAHKGALPAIVSVRV
ncbi:high nitrogen upregulated cytochrome P450 monooxygenase 2 [Peniophora sp. CONT]|nr:high nitrogen upregulated cytochrome P450 monooxygenase 2 [Peniophora sp. CONT]